MDGVIKAFAATRMAVGVVSWVSPPLAARIFGLNPVGAQEPIVSRLFGARECALAIATAYTSGDDRRKVLATGVAIDSVDLVACLIQIRAGEFSTQAKVLTAGGAACFAAIGAAALAATDEPARCP